MCFLDYAVMGQRDPRWAKKPLGTSTSTLGGYGCLVTSGAMMAGLLVDEFNAALVKAGAFVGPGDGRLRRPFDFKKWTRLGPAYIRESRRFPTRPFPVDEIAYLLDHLEEGYPAIIEVDMQPGGDQQQHFVLAVGAFGRVKNDAQVVINDPWFGDQVTLAPRYGTTLARAIVGAVYYGGE